MQKMENYTSEGLTLKRLVQLLNHKYIQNEKETRKTSINAPKKRRKTENI